MKYRVKQIRNKFIVQRRILFLFWKTLQVTTKYPLEYNTIEQAQAVVNYAQEKEAHCPY